MRWTWSTKCVFFVNARVMLNCGKSRRKYIFVLILGLLDSFDNMEYASERVMILWITPYHI